jgi:trypsin
MTARCLLQARSRPPSLLAARQSTARRVARICALLGAHAWLGCSGTSPDRSLVAKIESPIAYGTLDTVHTAVVAVLAPAGTTELAECGASIVQISGTTGYVLTAAHCCNLYVPTLVVVSNDYSVGEQYLSGATPAPPVYAVVAGSVYYDAHYNGNDHDFCMLQFSGATGSMSTVALPTSADDGLQVGSEIEHIGFGQTTTNPANASRFAGTDAVGALTNVAVEFNQGGSTDIPGTCDGDSGGPSLLPAGVAQAQQVIVAVQSYGGDVTTCAAETYGVGSRVISEIGVGAFITSYLANAPIGVQAGAEPVVAAPALSLWATVAMFLALVLVPRFH